MTLVELRYLIAVADERRFRRAAEKVFVSQPALSIAIARLEAELGVRLLERGKNEVSVTTIGAAVSEQARQTIRHLVACGEGISVLPHSAAMSPAVAALLETRPFVAPASSRRIALVSRRSFARPAARDAVAALLREARPEGLELAR